MEDVSNAVRGGSRTLKNGYARFRKAPTKRELEWARQIAASAAKKGRKTVGYQRTPDAYAVKLTPRGKTRYISKDEYYAEDPSNYDLIIRGNVNALQRLKSDRAPLKPSRFVDYPITATNAQYRLDEVGKKGKRKGLPVNPQLNLDNYHHDPATHKRKRDGRVVKRRQISAESLSKNQWLKAMREAYAQIKADPAYANVDAKGRMKAATALAKAAYGAPAGLY